jgi:DNA-binding MarR family transcriptional regulator
MSGTCYCIALRSAARRLAAHYDAALAPVGINVAQFSLMRKVARRAPLALTELGRLMELDRSTVGRNVRVLEKMGLVALGRGEDQREATVALTEAGQKVLAEGAPLWDAAQKAFEDKLGADAARDLRSSLAAI